MERIAIITPDSPRIADYLNSNLNNVEITTFNDIFEFYRRVNKSAFRTDTVLMMDNGLRDTTYGAGGISEGAALLKEILADRPLVEIERVVYLNKDKYPEHKKLIEFLQGSKMISARIIIAQYPEYQAYMIKELLIQNSQTYEDIDNKYKYVIRKKRNERTSSKILADHDTEKSVVLEHRTYNPDVSFHKEQLNAMVGAEPITSTVQDDDIIEGLDIPVEDYNHYKGMDSKVIAVVGESKSGASTTAMILGASGASYDQTLLIDMNYTNLGLSYLVEKTLIEDEINNIKLSEVISMSDGVKKLREDVFKKNSLHIISNSLPVKRQLSKNEFGFLIGNILRMYKRSYKYIILDIPIDELEAYSSVLTLVDRVVLCTPPYMNNIISLLTKVSKSPLIKSPAFSAIEDNKFRDVILFRTRIFSRVNKEIKAVKTDVINKYAKTLLKSELKITGIFVYDPRSYLDTIIFNMIAES